MNEYFNDTLNYNEIQHIIDFKAEQKLRQSTADNVFSSLFIKGIELSAEEQAAVAEYLPGVIYANLICKNCYVPQGSECVVTDDVEDLLNGAEYMLQHPYKLVKIIATSGNNTPEQSNEALATRIQNNEIVDNKITIPEKEKIYIETIITKAAETITLKDSTNTEVAQTEGVYNIVLLKDDEDQTYTVIPDVPCALDISIDDEYVESTDFEQVEEDSDATLTISTTKPGEFNIALTGDSASRNVNVVIKVEVSIDGESVYVNPSRTWAENGLSEIYSQATFDSNNDESAEDYAIDVNTKPQENDVVFTTCTDTAEPIDDDLTE